MSVEQVLLVTGASILGLLGTIHLVGTFFTNMFDPHDPKTGEAMKQTSPMLTKDTTMWDAWVGFNASHSLGPMIFAAIYIPLAAWHMDVIEGQAWFAVLPVLIGISYTALAMRYWFRVPLAGISLSTVCFAAAAILILG